jgi:hypothetical protein
MAKLRRRLSPSRGLVVIDCHPDTSIWVPVDRPGMSGLTPAGRHSPRITAPRAHPSTGGLAALYHALARKTLHTTERSNADGLVTIRLSDSTGEINGVISSSFVDSTFSGRTGFQNPLRCKAFATDYR